MSYRLNREELIKLVKIIMNGGEDEFTGKEYSEDEIDRMIEVFEESIKSPYGSDLIFYPDSCGLSPEATAEEIVNAGLIENEEK